MKTTIDFLNEKLSELDKNISEYQQSFEVGTRQRKYNPQMFSLESIETLSKRLSVFKNEREDILKCIAQIADIPKIETLKMANTRLKTEIKRLKEVLDRYRF